MGFLGTNPIHALLLLRVFNKLSKNLFRTLRCKRIGDGDGDGSDGDGDSSDGDGDGSGGDGNANDGDGSDGNGDGSDGNGDGSDGGGNCQCESERDGINDSANDCDDSDGLYYLRLRYEWMPLHIRIGTSTISIWGWFSQL